MSPSRAAGESGFRMLVEIGGLKIETAGIGPVIRVLAGDQIAAGEHQAAIQRRGKATMRLEAESDA